jgi:hypothetical protein
VNQLALHRATSSKDLAARPPMPAARWIVPLGSAALHAEVRARDVHFDPRTAGTARDQRGLVTEQPALMTWSSPYPLCPTDAASTDEHGMVRVIRVDDPDSPTSVAVMVTARNAAVNNAAITTQRPSLHTRRPSTHTAAAPRRVRGTLTSIPDDLLYPGAHRTRLRRR